MPLEDTVVRAFKDQYHFEPSFLVRAPGRVNLIGEHIDYNGFGVLPMALSQSIYCATGLEPAAVNGKAMIKIKNIDQKYESFEAQIVENFFEKDTTSHNWHKYFLCGVQGCLELLKKKSIPYELKNIFVLIGGDIPAGSGLSSSSALVCGAFLCALKAFTGRSFDILDRTSIADHCADCERYIGTQGGGMDQAVCLLAKAGKAGYITFNPLTKTDINLPPGATFLISNSMVESNKAAASYFNQRVLECRFACKLLSYKLGVVEPVKNFHDLQCKVQKTIPEMLAAIGSYFQRTSYTIPSLAEEMGGALDMDQCVKDACVRLKIDMQAALDFPFNLKERAKHVFYETERVQKFLEICTKFDDEKALDNFLDQKSKIVENDLQSLGFLMDESHKSCGFLYDCSCKELDALQEAIKTYGAYGSRLTGAGWGGCLVSLVDRDVAPDILTKLRQSYYQNLSGDVFNANVFVTTPGGGAEIVEF